MKTYNEIYLNSRSILRQRGIDGFSLEAKLIVAAAAGKTIAQLMRDLALYATPEIENKALDFTARRLRGEPIAYVTNSWEFYGLPMYVDSNVLIPRIDTEVVVDAAKELLTGYKMDARILDLCCGSGCIAVAVGHELPATRLVAVDISQEALEIAKRNLAANRLGSRAICMQADAKSAPPVGIGYFDMIISNPPYIASNEIPELDVSVRDFEPIWALDGGNDGLDFYRSIIKYWKVQLNPGGFLLFEVGEEQAAPVSEMLMSAGFTSCQTRKDTLGTERVVIGKL